ncbi:MAG TPA: hypothetical protein VNM34_02370 [Verrucomicrobiae bacterium]|nr:hypothetical protein [Verrucomicrobiae bacterium]
MLDQDEPEEIEVPVADLPDDPHDGMEDDPPIEPIPEDAGAPEDDVPSLIGDDGTPEGG